MASTLDVICDPATTIRTDFGCLPNNPVGFVAQFYGWGLGLIGLVGLLFLIIGGYYILMSRGNPETLQKGRSYILYAIIGILLAVFGFVFISVIAGNILKIPGFS
jgi:Na+-driven multidrug efflux pump